MALPSRLRAEHRRHPIFDDAAAEQGCMRDVTAQTNNPDVVLRASDFSQVGTEVITGIGPQPARWQCIDYADTSSWRPVVPLKQFDRLAGG